LFVFGERVINMNDEGGLLIQTIIAPLLTSIIALLTGKKLKEKTGWLCFIPLLYSFLLLLYINLNLQFWGGELKASYDWTPHFGKFMLLADGLSAPVALTIAFLSMVISIYSIYYMKGKERLNLYFSLYLLYAAGMIGTVLAVNFVAFFIFFEFMLLPSWALIGIWGTGRKELIAFKYFMFTEIGALSLLAGIASAYSLTGTLDMTEMGALTAKLSYNVIIPTVIAMLIGFFIKMAIFPLHSWLPDAHAEAPTPISALLSPAMIGIGGYASIRVIYEAFPKLVELWPFMIGLAILAFITMVYGGLMALAQDDIKRLLAYSSISQMGYMLFGIASASIIGVMGAILLYISHGLAKAVLFMIAGVFMHEFKTRCISDLRGLAGLMPVSSVVTLISFLSLAGVPPLLGFWSEIFIFAGSMYTAIKDGFDAFRVVITSLAVIMSVLTAGYGLWTIKRVFYGEPTERLRETRKEPLAMLAPTIVLAVFTVILGIYPTPIANLVNESLKKIFELFLTLT